VKVTLKPALAVKTASRAKKTSRQDALGSIFRRGAATSVPRLSLAFRASRVRKTRRDSNSRPTAACANVANLPLAQAENGVADLAHRSHQRTTNAHFPLHFMRRPIMLLAQPSTGN
jgi:hypothetical protein